MTPAERNRTRARERARSLRADPVTREAVNAYNRSLRAKKPKKGRHSAYIPEGMLPKYSDDPARYHSEYQRLRKIHDPEFRENINRTQRERRRK